MQESNLGPQACTSTHLTLWDSFISQWHLQEKGHMLTTCCLTLKLCTLPVRVRGPVELQCTLHLHLVVLGWKLPLTSQVRLGPAQPLTQASPDASNPQF